MQINLYPHEVYEMLEWYRSNHMTTRDESRFLAATKHYQVAKLVRAFAPKMLKHHAEREMGCIAGAISGVHFEVGVHEQAAEKQAEHWMI